MGKGPIQLRNLASDTTRMGTTRTLSSPVFLQPCSRSAGLWCKVHIASIQCDYCDHAQNIKQDCSKEHIDVNKGSVGGTWGRILRFMFSETNKNLLKYNLYVGKACWCATYAALQHFNIFSTIIFRISFVITNFIRKNAVSRRAWKVQVTSNMFTLHTTILIWLRW